MDPKQLRMIYRVAQEYKSRKTKKGPVKDGPYWFGYWIDNGKVRRVYIGKELTPELQILLQTRSKAPGKTNYAWPGRAQAA
ncbi:hypothetical protein ES703_38710 [subsurface metagenome]